MWIGTFGAGVGVGSGVGVASRTTIGRENLWPVWGSAAGSAPKASTKTSAPNRTFNRMSKPPIAAEYIHVGRRVDLEGRALPVPPGSPARDLGGRAGGGQARSVGPEGRQARVRPPGQQLRRHDLAEQ